MSPRRLEPTGTGCGTPQIFLYQREQWRASWLCPGGLKDYYVITLSLRWRWQDMAGQATMNALDMKMSRNGALGVLPNGAMQTLDDFLMENLPGIPADLVRARLARLKTPETESV